MATPDTTFDQQAANGIARLVGSFFGGVINAISLFVLAIFVFSLLGRFSFVAELVGNFRAQILAMLIPCAIGALLFRRWYIGSALVVAVAWGSVGVLSVYLPVDQPPAGTETIRLMSFNVLASSNAFDGVKKSVADADPDVLVVVEYDSKWHKQLQSLVDDGDYPFHHRVPRWHGFGIAIFSKRPLFDSSTQQLAPKITDSPMIMSEIEVGGRRIRLAGLHVMSPMSRQRMKIRNQQLKEAASHLAGDSTPTIVMGDFNCTPWSPFLDDFFQKTGYRDSRQGFGYQGTWYSRLRWPALIPIDHAFVSDEIRVHDRYVGKTTTSDHYPIIFDISVRP